MKKSIKTIGTTGAMTILLSSAYLLGTTQVKTIPEGYIKLSECIPLEDMACFFIDGYNYPCFELKDVGNQLDNPNNRSYTDIMQNMEDTTEYFRNNFVDMQQIADFNVNGNGLQLYLKDGTVYYWER